MKHRNKVKRLKARQEHWDRLLDKASNKDGFLAANKRPGSFRSR